MDGEKRRLHDNLFLKIQLDMHGAIHKRHNQSWPRGGSFQKIISNIRHTYDEGGGRGGCQKSPNIDDVSYEWPLKWKTANLCENIANVGGDEEYRKLGPRDLWMTPLIGNIEFTGKV